MVATNPAAADELAAPLDLLLTSSAVGIAERVMPNVSWSRCALNLGRQPRTVASRAASLGRQLVSIAGGRSDVAPTSGDKRFTDPAWLGNPLLKRTMQAYLAANTTVDQLFSDAHLEWRDSERVRFVLDVVTEAGTGEPVRRADADSCHRLGDERPTEDLWRRIGVRADLRNRR